jgi:chromosome segregation ATPase
MQALDAQAFDVAVSPSLKAGLVAEIRQRVDQAVAAAHQEARITEEMFHAICKDLDTAQETINTLRNDLAASTSRNGDEIRRLELDLAAARERLVGAEEAKGTMAEARDTAIRAQGEAREEVTRLTVHLAEVNNELSAERSRAFSLQQRLAEAEREREAAAQKAALDEQRAAHAESTAEGQKERVRDLRDELSDAKAGRAELQARVSDLLERLGQAEIRAAVAEERAPKKKPSSKGGVTAADTKNASATEGGNGKSRP